MSLNYGHFSPLSKFEAITLQNFAAFHSSFIFALRFAHFHLGASLRLNCLGDMREAAIFSAPGDRVRRTGRGWTIPGWVSVRFGHSQNVLTQVRQYQIVADRRDGQ